MVKLSLEYQQAKESYKATSRDVDGKENRTGKTIDSTELKQEKKAESNNSLKPTFQHLEVKQASKPEPETKCKPIKQHLPSEYKTAKLRYRSSKSRAGSRKESKATNNSTSRLSSRRPTTATKVNNDAPPVTTSTPPPTAENGLAKLNLVRPLDNKEFQFGLAQGIQVHLVESIKLCGLRKGREKSLIDMVSTLCNHLTNREDEINRWNEFADTVAKAADDKLNESLHEYQKLCGSIDEAQHAAKEAHMALVEIRKEVQSLKADHDNVKEEVLRVLVTFPSLMKEFEGRLRRQLAYQCDSIRSESKSEFCDAVEELTRAHDNEKQQLETTIGSLEMSLQQEREKVESLQSQAADANSALEKEKSEHKSKQTELQVDVDKAQSVLLDATETIKSLEKLLEDDRNQHKKELEEHENKMKAELDDIDQKVKRSFDALVECKNREIEKALNRARAAEESSKAAEKLLSELKASFVPKPKASTAEATSES